jgi:hypothetical protein
MNKTPSIDSENGLRIESFSDDGEPRAHDESIANKLGYARIDTFRSLIRRHRKILNNINHLCAMQTSPERQQGGGRRGKEYWLTKSQIVFLVGKSETPVAEKLFAEIAIAFVEFQRQSFPMDQYGALIRDLLLPSPREWQLEYPESFWKVLHEVGKWPRPPGNNHSNCAHFINKFIYEYLLGKLGLKALQDANPANDDGERAHRHHQILKVKHLEKVRDHIKIVERLLAGSRSIKHFSDVFASFFEDSDIQLGFLFEEEGSTKKP